MLCVVTAVPDAVVFAIVEAAKDADAADDGDDCDEGRDANDNISDMINCEDKGKSENERSKDDGDEIYENDDIDRCYEKNENGDDENDNKG